MKIQRVMIGMACSLFLVSGCSKVSHGDIPSQSTTKQRAENDVSELNWKIKDFVFTDHHGELFGTKDMKGKVWLADFVFTRCPNICPPMTANMVRLQKALSEKNLQVPTVSFSVDPAHDTPEVLKSFAKEHAAELHNWHFLTGYEQKEIQEMAKVSFKGIVEPQKQPSPEYPMLVNHPSLFYIVDGDGRVVRFYDGLNPNVDQIVKDLQDICKER